MKFRNPIAIGTLVLTFVLGACTGGGGESKVKDTYQAFYSYDPKSFNYASTNKGEDTAFFANFVDGLYEGDRLGLAYKPALADGEPVASTWTDSVTQETGLRFTVKVKKDIPWVNSVGVVQEKYGSLKPSDFITTAEIALNPNLTSDPESSAYMYMTFIRGATEYFRAVAAGGLADISSVGIKADDTNYTLTYDLIEELNVESFKSALTYSCFLPINTQFNEDLKGRGRKFGAVDNVDSMLYNGAYTLTKIVKGQSYRFRRNPYYWDVENVPTENIYLIRYPDGGGNNTAREYFEKKYVDGFTPNINDSRGWKKYVTGSKGLGTFYNPDHPDTQVVENITSSTIWYNSFNFNRIEDNKSNQRAVVTQTNNFLKVASIGGNSYANAVNELKGTTEDAIGNQILNTKKALANRDFRLGLQHSYPRSLQLVDATPHDPEQWMRNNMTMPDFLAVEPGVDYLQKVAEHYSNHASTNPDELPTNLVNNRNKDEMHEFINDGNDALFNPNLAEVYFERAKIALTAQGVKFPVMLLDVMPYSLEQAAIYEEFAKFYNGLKSGEVIGNRVPANVVPEYGRFASYLNYSFVGLESTNYTNAMDSGFYDMMTVGWTPDYADPLTYVATHCSGGMMAEDLNKIKPNTALASLIYGNVDAKLAEASAAGHNGDAAGRLSKIAEAEYYMVHHDAIVLPVYASGIGQGIVVSRIIPYLLQRNPVGLASDKYKGVVVMTKPITKLERAELYQQFLLDKAAALA